MPVSLGSMFVELGVRDKLTAGLATAKASLSRFKTGVGQVATGIKGLALPITAGFVAIGFGIRKTITAFGEFQQSMANAASVSGATGEEFKTMTEFARKLGETTVFSAKEAADAMYFVASAGFSAGEQMKATGAILDFAAATQIDLASATGQVVDTLSAFGLKAEEAGRVSNVFAAAIGATQATADRLRESMKLAAPTAKLMGASLEETTTALALLEDAGIHASTAGTTFRMAMDKLAKPSSEAREVMERLNLTFHDTTGNLLPLSAIFAELRTAEISVADASRLLGIRGKALISAAKLEGKTFDELRKKITGTTKAKEMAARQIDTLQGSFKLLRSRVMEAFIAVGEKLSPVIRGLADKIRDVIPILQKFAEQAVSLFKNRIVPIFVDSWKKIKAILTSAEIGGAVGAFKKSFADGLVATIEKVVGVIPKLVEWFIKVGPSITSLVGKITGLIVAISPFIPLIAAAMFVLGPLVTLFSGLTSVVVALIPVIYSLGVAILTTPLGWILLGIIAVIAIVKAVMFVIQNWGDKTKWMVDVLLSLLGPIGWVISAIRHWDEIGPIVANALNKIGDFVNKVISYFGNLVSNAIGWGKDLVMNFADGIKDRISKVWSAIKGVKDYFEDLWDRAYDWGKNLIKNFANGIYAAYTHVKSAVKKVIRYITRKLGFGPEILNDMMVRGWGSAMISNFAKGITQSAPLISNALEGVLGGPSPLMATPTRELIITPLASPKPIIVENYIYLDSSQVAKSVSTKIAEELTTR